MSINLREGLLNQLVDHILEDLLVRFVINVPEEDWSLIERVLFQVEEAQWFYTDFVRALNPKIQGMKMKTFAPKILEKCPMLWKWGEPSDALAQFGKYKQLIPVRGVALLNKDLSRMVLVKGTESATWSFPRGKISKDESDLECAIREAREETGFDARPYLNENDVLERTIRGKNFKIFLARGVPEDTEFEPLVRNEIAEIRWHDIKALQKGIKQTPNKYFVIDKMLKPLKHWINKNKGSVSEEEMMRDAETRLKALMGLDQEPAPLVDAGRELLDILQGATHATQQPGSSQPQQNFQMSVPQHLHSIYSGLSQMPQFFPMQGQPFVPPPNFVPPQFMPPIGQVPVGQPPMPQPVHGQMAPQAPPQPSQNGPAQAQPSQNGVHGYPVAAPLPQSTTPQSNSKELLSLLKGPPLKQKAPEQPAQEKAQTPQPAEEPKKITLLKRETEKDASATLLGILGRKPPAESPKPESPQPESSKADASHKTHPPAADFLSILNGPKKAKEQHPEQEQQQRKPSGSAELLSILKREPLASSSANTALSGAFSAFASRDPHASTLAQSNPAQELLGVLHRKPTAPTASANQQASNELFKMLQNPNKPIRLAKRGEELPAELTRSQTVSPAAPPASAPVSQAPAEAGASAPTLTAGNQTLEPDKEALRTSSDDFDNFEHFDSFDDLNVAGGGYQDHIYKLIADTFDAETDDEDPYPESQFNERMPAASALPKPEAAASIYDAYRQPEAPSLMPAQAMFARPSGNGADLLLLLKRGR